MAQKKNNSRKALAVALGIMGVAGLSVASASQLTATPGTEAAIGVATFAACDTAVAVDYAYSPTTFNITTLTVTGIETACVGQPILFSLEDSASPTPAVVATGTGTVASGGNHVFTISGTVPVSTDLGKVTIVIG